MLKQKHLFIQCDLCFLARRCAWRMASVLALSLSLQQAHSTEAYSFKGAKLGASVSQFLLLNPEFKCSPPVHAVVDCSSATSTYAGLTASNIAATFIEGKLSYVGITLANGPDEPIALFAFQTTEDALSGKYGASQKASDKTGSLRRLLRIWRADKQTLQLSHATNGTLHIVSVMISRDDHWERSVNLQKAKAKGDI